MLAYAFQALRRKNYEKVETEEFDNVQDLFAAVISIGVAQQLKQGLYREYIVRNESLPVLRGKLDLPETIRLRSINERQQLACIHDELSVNNIFNQILRSTMEVLMRDRRVKNENRAKLRKLLDLFDDVDSIKLANVNWSQLSFRRNNKNYEMLLNFCYFVYSETILSGSSGNKKVLTFSDESAMSALYERFILEYYKLHHPELSASASMINWALDSDYPVQTIKFLPKMQTDITLRSSDHTLIIDAKYYAKITQEQYDRHTVRNSHLYQIYAYVKNEDRCATGDVSGLLLYAQTDSDIIPSLDFSTGGNRISVKTLDLNRDFTEIKQQLDDIVEVYFTKARA
jgi:5-methylcytosine-specific restriction enzyme subunit McrC